MRTEAILNIPVHGVNLQEAIGQAKTFLKSKEYPFIIHTANANVLVLAQRDKLLRDSFLTADMLLPDGQGAVLGSKLFGRGYIKEKVSGPDFFDTLTKTLNENGKRTFFFLGTTNETLAKIKAKLEKDFPNIKYEGYSPPFESQFNEQQSSEMIKAINKVQPDVLWVGMTAPKQENWIEQHKHKIDAQLIVTVGAAFDYFAENTKRCPRWLEKLMGNTEFFYRFLLNPKRMLRRTFRSAVVYPMLLLRKKLRFH